MQKPGRNNPCPCASGKKYKYCFLANDKDCKLFQKEKQAQMFAEHEQKLTRIVQILPTFTADLNQLFYRAEENGDDIIPSRMQLIGIFTIVDVLANYWSEYVGKTGKPSERFFEFLHKFGFVEANSEYTNRKYLGDFTIEQLYELRNGLVHFYGLNGINVSIILNPSKEMTEEKITEWCNNIRALAKAKNMGNMHFVQPWELKKIVVESAALMVEHIRREQSKSSEEANMAHVEGIARIDTKLQKEGAVPVTKEEAEVLGKKIAGKAKNKLR